MKNPTIFIVVPTFNESEKVSNLLRCFGNVFTPNLKVIVVNGNPGDETTRMLRAQRDERVLELPGSPDKFWSGLVNIGLRHIITYKEERDKQGFVILMNADVDFDASLVPGIVEQAIALPNSQLAATTVADGRVLSSGVKVRSWFLTINRHPLAGLTVDSIPPGCLIPVDFLPARCTIMPISAIESAGLIAEVQLPHYGADYEYTNRVRKCGYGAFIMTDAVVRVDKKNTGNSIYHKKLWIWRRLRYMFSVKSSYNPLFRFRFVVLSYPMYAIPSALLLYSARTFIEVMLGGPLIKKISDRGESGFSGS